jgi:hypothetical protein
VLDYLDRQEESRESKAFLQEVKDTIRECLQTLPTAELDGMAQTTAAENDDDEISPLDFIDAMTGGCNFSL